MRKIGNQSEPSIGLVRVTGGFTVSDWRREVKFD